MKTDYKKENDRLEKENRMLREKVATLIDMEQNIRTCCNDLRQKNKQLKKCVKIAMEKEAFHLMYELEHKVDKKNLHCYTPYSQYSEALRKT